MCQPHQLWRFPRSTEDLVNGNGSPFTLGLDQLNEQEYFRLHEFIWRYHSHSVSAEQCCSIVVQRIRAPVQVVWSVVRRFDNPQAYKNFIRSCSMWGDGMVGSTREVRLVSGLPAATSTERLEMLDEERHVLSFRIVGGEHRLKNYKSITTLHDFELDGRPGTIVMESYAVDIPVGNSRDDTRIFADTIVKCNLQSLAKKAERYDENSGRPMLSDVQEDLEAPK